ncbi:DUF1289 domain-containing protein [Polycyclovorans algicola]|uniref:DUF1289 domain-containing protein n=1 Tax=Polycyclovorans algicola TaxID=616992 RepID=UPI0034509268
MTDPIRFIASPGESAKCSVASGYPERMKTRQDDPVTSPCIKQCELTKNQVCLGCGRHLDEIVGWQMASTDQRRIWCADARQRLSIIEASISPSGPR